MAEEREINIDIVINAAQSAKTIKEQREALKGLNDALNKVKEGSGAFELLTEEAAKLKNQLGGVNLTFDDVYNGVQPLTTRLGELEDQMYELALAGKQNTDEFKQLQTQAINFRRTIQDVDASVDNFSQRGARIQAIGQVFEGIVGSIGLVTTALEALGLSSSTAEESIKKLQIVQTALVSIQAISEVVIKTSAANQLLLNAARAIGINLVVAETSATGQLTIAQRLLNAVQSVSPMGALLLVVGGLTTAYTLLTGKTKEQEKAEKAAEEQKKKLAEETKKYNEYIGNESAEYVTLIGRLSQTNPKSQERLDLITKINKTYGTTLKNIVDETTFQNQLNKSVDDYINFLKLKYSLQANEKLIQANLTKQADLTTQLNKAEQDLQASIKARKDSGYEDTGRDLRIALELQYQVIDDLKSQLDAADGRLRGYINNSIAASNKIASTGLRTSSETIKETSNKTSKANEDLKKQTSKIIDNLVDIEVQALERLKRITIDINAEKVKPKVIQELEKLKDKVGDIRDEVGSVIPNVKAFNDAFIEGSKTNISVLDEFGSKFQDLRGRLSKLFTSDLERNAFIEEIKKIRTEFQGFEPEQKKFVNTVTENYIKARDLITKDALELIGRDLPAILNKDEQIIKITPEFEKLTDVEKGLKIYTDLLKDKLKFEGVDFFGITPLEGENAKAVISDVTKTVEEKINALIQIQFTGKKKLETLNKELIEEQNKLATLQTQSGGDADVLQKYSEDRIKIIQNEIGVVEKGIGVLQKTIDAKDFEVFQEIFPERTYRQVSDGLSTIEQALVKLDVNKFKQFLLTQKGITANDEILTGLNKTIEEQIQLFQTVVGETAKAENQVRGYTFEIQELGKELGITTKETDLFIEAIEKDIPNLTDKFDFKKLKTEYRDFADETKSDKSFGQGLLDFFGIFPKRVAEGNAEATLENQKFLQENTKTINEFLIKNGVSAELLAKLNGDQIKKLNKIFVDEAAKTDDQILKDRRQKYLDFYSSLTSEIFGFLGQITQNASEATISVLNQEKEAALEKYDAEIEANKFKEQEISNAEQLKLDKEKKRALDREKIEEEYNRKIREAEYQGAIAKWNYAINEAIIQTALGVMKAAPNVFLMATTGIIGALQVAKISANKPAKYATGGLISGPGGPKDDKVPAYLSNGESVINANSTKMFLPMLDMINRAGGGAPLINTPNPMMANGGVVNQSQSDSFSRLEDLIMKVVDRPIKTYVVSSDVSSAQSKDKRLKDRTTF